MNTVLELIESNEMKMETIERAVGAIKTRRDRFPGLKGSISYIKTNANEIVGINDLESDKVEVATSLQDLVDKYQPGKVILVPLDYQRHLLSPVDVTDGEVITNFTSALNHLHSSIRTDVIFIDFRSELSELTSVEGSPFNILGEVTTEVTEVIEKIISADFDGETKVSTNLLKSDIFKKWFALN